MYMKFTMYENFYTPLDMHAHNVHRTSRDVESETSKKGGVINVGYASTVLRFGRN